MIPQNRPLTSPEREWLEQGLATLATGQYRGGGCLRDLESGELLPLDPPLDPAPYLAQLDGLRVRGRCGCRQADCHTLCFRQGESHCLVQSTTADGRLLFICIDPETRLLTELEVIGVTKASRDPSLGASGRAWPREPPGGQAATSPG